MKNALSLAVNSIVIVGGVGGTNLGESLRRGAPAGYEVTLVDQAAAMSRNRLVQRVFWHLGGHRPVHLSSFSRRVVGVCEEQRASLLITTGAAPVTAQDLRSLRGMGVLTINFSTDDPFNPGMRAAWHLSALPHYDIVFTPRTSTIEELRTLGCKDVRYLPFGYDEQLFAPVPAAEVQSVPVSEVLFVGGADRDRANFFHEFLQSGLRPTLAGSYWERFPEVSGAVRIGQKPAAELRALTARAAVNLCLVRRANRDGHVMRSFEIPACGGFILAEDTEDHRAIFGPEGSCALYFATPADAADKARWALDRPEERRRIAHAALVRITEGKNRYADRLGAILTAAAEVRARRSLAHQTEGLRQMQRSA